jgi:5-oxoprolinase (ATP-hydrolysing)
VFNQAENMFTYVFAVVINSGGESAQKGANYLKASNEDRLINLGSKATVDVVAGDQFILKTPGGGAYGEYRG